MKEQDKKMILPKLDDLFTNQEQRDYDSAEKVQEIDISKIKNFPEHPFQVNDDEKMKEMVKSVKEYGVILPVIVRPKEDGSFEMVSGHRRKRACELAGIKQIRAIVKDLSDDEATILMVDSNIQREEILPSERAFAYRMKLEAMKHQGKKEMVDENITYAPLVQKYESEQTSRQALANEAEMSREQIRRYIRLTYLIPELLEEVDKKRIAFRPAVELSYLEEDYQYVVLNKLQYDEVSPSLSQAITLKKMQQEVCTDGINWFKEKNEWHDRGESYYPIVGDIIFFDWYDENGNQDGNCDHVGIVTRTDIDNRNIYTIEGNTSNKCAERMYSFDDVQVIGYGSPKYE